MPSLKFGTLIRGKKVEVLLQILLYRTVLCHLDAIRFSAVHLSQYRARSPSCVTKTNSYPVVKVALMTKSISHVRVLKENAVMN